MKQLRKLIVMALAYGLPPAMAAETIKGNISPADVQDLQNNVSQLRSLTNQRIQEYNNQLNAIINGLDVLKQRNDQVQQILFGGSVQSTTDNSSINNSVGAPAQIKGKPLVGSVTEMSPIIDKLMPQALLKNDQWLTAVQKELKYSSTTQKALAFTKDTLNYLIPYKGFGPSAEAGDIILNDQVKIKSLASARYVKQRIIDETHLQVMTAVMELASDINKPESFESLKALVGDQAQEIKDILSSHSGDTVPKLDWDVLEKQRRYKLLVKAVISQDKVVNDITTELNKYNKKSKLSMNTSKVLEPVLGALSLTPSLIGPSAKMALCSYVMVTGGPEQEKLLKELYLDRSLQSRLNLIAEESHLALDAYYTACNTNNPTLFFAADSLISQMLKDNKDSITN